MEPFAITDQLVLGRPLADDEIVDAETLLARASRMIRRLFPDVDTRIAAGEILTEDVADVVCTMVQRVLNRNRPGVAAVTDQRGPFSLTEKYSNPEGGLYMTADDRAVFAPPGTVPKKAFSIDTGVYPVCYVPR